MLEAGFCQLLNADPTVASLFDSRIYPVLWPDTPQFPLATYQRVSTVAQSVLDGPLSLTTARIQFDTYAKSYAQVKLSTGALNNILEGYVGVLPTGTQVLDVTLDSSFDAYDEPSATYRVSTDYLITFLR